MAFRARKVSGAFEKRADGILLHCENLEQKQKSLLRAIEGQLSSLYNPV